MMSSVTFILHDAGETRALTPVMKQLDGQNVSYNIFAEGTARQLTSGNPHVVPSQAEITAAQKQNPNLSNYWQQKLNQALQATCYVTGLTSTFQKQWADFLKSSGKRVIGYYDGFTANHKQNPADAFAGSLTDLITPTQDMANFFKLRGFSNISVVPLGQPSVESISQTIQNTNVPLLATRLGLSLQTPTILWVGQMGADYEAAFRLFCQTIHQFPMTNILIAPHPSQDGSIENSILEQLGLQNRIHILPKNVRTEEVLALSNTVLSYNSTMAYQAALQGKKVILVGKLNTELFNPLREQGLAPQCETPQALIAALSQALTSPEASMDQPQQLYTQLGLPSNSEQNVTQYILNAIQIPNGRIESAF